MRPTAVNFIGAGNLGKTIATLIAKQSTIVIQGVCNSSLESSQQAINLIGQGTAYGNIIDLPPADITFITTPDNDIETCCHILSTSKQLKPSSIIVHCSGSLSSDVLSAVKIQNCHVASTHPMRSFANPEISIREYEGTYCAIEGDEDAITILQPLFLKIGSITYTIDRSKKAMYHAAGVFASNYLIAIAERSQYCLKQAGVDNGTAINITLSLMQGTLKNLEITESPEKSLTGPIKRGDIETIKKHLKAMPNKRLSDLYKSLGLATVRVAKLKNNKAQEIESLLSADDSEYQPTIKAKL